MIRKLFNLLVAIFLGTGFCLQAETAPLQSEECNLLHKIVENQEYCVSSFDGDKIFMRPENIVPTAQGLCINLNGSELCPLPLLQFSKQGHFVQANFLQGIVLAAAKKATKGPCPNCNVNIATADRILCDTPQSSLFVRCRHLPKEGQG